MDASSRNWASGVWVVKSGREEEFVERWKTWLGWTKESTPGFRSAILLRSDDDGRRFESFSDWDDDESRAAWQNSEGFRERFGSVRELCDEFVGGNFEVAAVFPR